MSNCVTTNFQITDKGCPYYDLPTPLFLITVVVLLTFAHKAPHISHIYLGDRY